MGFSIAYFLTVADIQRSLDFYEQVFGARILSRGDSDALEGTFKLVNAWMIINVPEAARTRTSPR